MAKSKIKYHELIVLQLKKNDNKENEQVSKREINMIMSFKSEWPIEHTLNDIKEIGDLSMLQFKEMKLFYMILIKIKGQKWEF